MKSWNCDSRRSLGIEVMMPVQVINSIFDSIPLAHSGCPLHWSAKPANANMQKNYYRDIVLHLKKDAIYME